MQVRLALRPRPKRGTAKARKRYGNRLISGRYRNDETLQMRLKTVERIEEQMPWVPARRGKRAR